MDIRRLNLQELTSKELKTYEKLTTEENICYLHHENPSHLKDLVYIAIAAFENDKPIGLLLGTSSKSGYIADLYSIFVEEKKRNYQIATKLMKAFEDELKQLKSIVVTMLYPSNIKDATIFKHLLQKSGWANPFPFIYRYSFKAASFNPSWFCKGFQYPENIRSFFWSEVTESEKEELKRQEEQYRFPREVSPFLDESNIEPLNSLGLRDENEIIGWIITHRINESTIRYSSLYIDPKYQFSGFSILLLIESIKLQKKLIDQNHPARLAFFYLNLYQTDHRWQHFIKRRLAPYADEFIVINQTWKDLSI